MTPEPPGVYIEEINSFPSVVAVETAMPVFIGYTQKAVRGKKSLLHIPVKITSLVEYEELFGKGFDPRFTILENAAASGDYILINGKKMQVQVNDHNTLYFYQCMRFFYQNGGAGCYILSVGTYGGQPGFEIDLADFTGNAQKPGVFAILEKEKEPTLIVLPDVIAKGIAAYPLYKLALQHCAKMQSRFAILDVWQSNQQIPGDDIQQFRVGIGNEFLNWGAAYYPWLHTSVIQDGEIDFMNLDASIDLVSLLPEAAAKNIAAGMKTMTHKKLKENRASLNQSLLAGSNTYVSIMQAIKAKRNLLPPAAAMAGIYTTVDHTRGVSHAPANISLAMVVAPAVALSQQQQQNMNVDPVSGKFINAIRAFPGQGILVWGARTLDGNSQDWRYINVKRTMIMIEQSVKLAMQAFVFEPNTNQTWVTLKSMVNNFLTQLWKQGTLQGVKPEQAFNVQIGLGITMTADDILNHILRLTVMVALARPAEFIVITIQQQQS